MPETTTLRHEIALSTRQSIRSAWSGASLRSMELGWHGYYLKQHELFLEFGYQSEAEFRDAEKISVRTWGRMVRLAEAFSQLTKAEFLAMTADNAEHLAKLPEEERYDPAWLEAARSLSSVALQRRILEHQAKQQGVAVGEVRVKWSCPMFEGQKKVIQQGVEEFRQQHGLKEAGTALEWIVMENTGRETLMGFMQRSVPVLRRALKKETVEEMRELLAEYVTDLAAAVEVVQGKRR